MVHHGRFCKVSAIMGVLAYLTNTNQSMLWQGLPKIVKKKKKNSVHWVVFMVTWYCSKSSARCHHEILPQSSEQFWQDEHLYLYPLMVQWTQCHNCETWIICFVNCTKALLPGIHCSFFFNVCVCTFGGFRSCRVHLWSAQTHHRQVLMLQTCEIVIWYVSVHLRTMP